MKVASTNETVTAINEAWGEERKSSVGGLQDLNDLITGKMAKIKCKLPKCCPLVVLQDYICIH